MASLWDDVRRPNLKVREKLSSLVRRGSLRSIKTKASGHGGVTTAHAAPILEVDLERVKSLRLADGWLEDAAPPSPERPSSKRRNGRGRNGARESERVPEAQRYSTTPIADLYSMSTDQLASTLEIISRKPSRKPVPVSQTAPLTASPPRPAPPEPEQLPVVRISLRHSVVEGDDTPIVPTSRASVDGGRRHSVQQVNLLRSVGTNTTGLRVSATGGGDNGTTGSSGSGMGVNLNAAHKRFSASSIPSPAVAIQSEMPPPPRPPVLEIKTTETRTEPPRTAASLTTPTPLESRRRSWQPTRATSPAPTPTTPNANAPPQRTLSTRPPSAALNSSRLAWIRELENKSSSQPSTGSSRNKVSSGGVASKLAMFETIQTRNSKPKQLSAAPVPLSRSNTSSSRVSSGGTSLGFGGESVSTARTSFDSDSFSTVSGVRSKRSSLVMAYYDEGFREKMEGVVAKQLDDKKEEVKEDGKEEGKEEVKEAKVDEAEKIEKPVELEAEAEKPKATEPELKVEVEEVKASEGVKEAEIVVVPAEVQVVEVVKSAPSPSEETRPVETPATTNTDAETVVEEQSEPEPVRVEEKTATVSIVVNEVAETSPQEPVVEVAEKQSVQVQVIPQEEESPKIETPQGALEEHRDEIMAVPVASTGTQE